MTSASNRAALIKRSYYANGLLETDSTQFRSYASPPSAGAKFGIRHTYDQNGRPATLSYPAELSATGTGYQYLPWGALERVTGLMSEHYTFAYDNQSRVESITYPTGSGAIERFAYDEDGRRVRRQMGIGLTPASIYNDTITYDSRGKIKRVQMRAIGREAEHWYSGLGQVAAARWQSTFSSDFQVDEFRADAHGNTYFSRKRDPANLDPEYLHHYSGMGQLERIEAQNIQAKGGTNSFRVFAVTGDLSFATDIPHVVGTGETMRRITRYYYSADGKLAFVRRFARGTAGNDDLTEETRYDALGRRILVRTQHAPMGATGALPAITRFVWNGSELVAELRAPGGTSDNLEVMHGTGQQFGKVVYVNGGALDAPLGVVRQDFGSNTTLIVPFTNWRGQYERGAFLNGNPECPGAPGQTCLVVDWPAPKLRTGLDRSSSGGGHWVGSLLQDQRGENGLLYRRNRYYDPQSGQFTQQDPIGLAGGLNLYGFADGDAVNFSDPFGLCPECRMGWGSPTPENIDQEARYYASLTNRDRVVLGASVLVAATGGFAILQAGAGAAGAVFTAATMASSAAPVASNPRLQNVFNALFRAGDKISGGTAGAIRHEALTGQAVGGRFHLPKGIARIRNLERVIRDEDLSTEDLQAAQRALSDLREAVRFARSRQQ